MKPLKLIATATIIAASLPALAEDKSGMMEEKTEQQGTQMMGTHMMDRETMLKHMQANNAELDKLVAAMNSAQGNEKVNAIAAVVNKLAEIHKEMSNRMMQRFKSGMGSGSRMKGMMSGE